MQNRNPNTYSHTYFLRQWSLCNTLNSLHSFTQTSYHKHIYHQSEQKHDAHDTSAKWLLVLCYRHNRYIKWFFYCHNERRESWCKFFVCDDETQKYVLYIRPLMANRWPSAVHADDLNCHYAACGNKHLI